MAELRGPLHSMVFRNADLPVLFHYADAIAITRQRQAVNANRSQLVLLVLAAALAALPWEGKLGGTFQLVGAFSALAYAGVLLFTLRSAGHRAKSHWQLNRSAAEFIKSMSWRYAVHGAPFDSGAEDPAGLFTTRMEAGLREAQESGLGGSARWGRDPGGSGPTHHSSHADAARQGVQRPQGDLRQGPAHRAAQLVPPAHGDLPSRHHALGVSITLITLLALFLAVLRTFSVTGSSAVLGLLSASAAACLAWSEIRRHQPLISAHSLVEDDLAAMHTAMATMVTEAQWANAVYETERIVSPQHTDWLVRHRS